MKFFDSKEYDPESYGYLVFTQKEIDKELKKREEDPSYRPSLELIRKFNQPDNVYHYKLKLKGFKVGESFYRGEDDFYLNIRIE